MKGQALGILDVLQGHGFEVNGRYKLVRHREPSKGYDMEQFRSQGWLDWYQAFQAKPVFAGLDYIVSFVGVGSTQARFYGVYKVAGCVPSEQGPQPPVALSRRTGEDWKRPGGYYYQLEHVPGYEDLEDVLIIEWGNGARSWHQWPRNKSVIQDPR